MIFEAIVNLLVGVVELILNAMGSAGAPGWLSGIGSNLSGLVSAGSSLGVWVPWPVLGSVLAAVATCWGISLAVRVIRILISLFTGGGGSAA